MNLGQPHSWSDSWFVARNCLATTSTRHEVPMEVLLKSVFPCWNLPSLIANVVTPESCHQNRCRCGGKFQKKGSFTARERANLLKKAWTCHENYEIHKDLWTQEEPVLTQSWYLPKVTNGVGISFCAICAILACPRVLLGDHPEFVQDAPAGPIPRHESQISPCVFSMFAYLKSSLWGNMKSNKMYGYISDYLNISQRLTLHWKFGWQHHPSQHFVVKVLTDCHVDVDVHKHSVTLLTFATPPPIPQTSLYQSWNMLRKDAVPHRKKEKWRWFQGDLWKNDWSGVRGSLHVVATQKSVKVGRAYPSVHHLGYGHSLLWNRSLQ